MTRFLLAVLLVMLTHGTATAHHAFAANFDIDNVGTIEGRVEEIFWANPHVHFYVRVAGDDGSGELWDVEWGNLGNMSRRGWKRGTLKVGDEIRISGALGRDGRRRIWVEDIERLNGPPLP